MFSGIVLCRFPKKLIRTVVFVLFLCLGMSLIIPQTIRAASSITVSGLTFPRSRVPLVDSSGNVSSDLYEGASNLVSALQDSGNFGAGGTVPCSIDFQPFVTEINPSSLVSGGNRTVDIFFAGVTDTTLSSSEADELATFINAGGIVYISGSAFHHDYGLSNEGPSFNPLFNALGISDSFSTGIDESSFMGESSDPSDTTPITGGPFGNISGMTHWSFRIINTSSLTQLADGFESGGMVVMSVTPGSGLSDEIVLAEGAFSSGYLSVTGDPMYTDFLTGMDSDNLNYFLNLFALGCSDGGEPPTTPTPFLDLPWDYGGKGLSFSDAALAINSFFDHEYPLLSTGLGEPVESRDTVTNFRGKFRTNLEYSSHDGYDWGRKAKATKGESVLAAASGTATYWGSCDACGNAILIDHGNGYQTRYYHLLDEGLIVDQEGQSVSVAKGQQIGLVGFTGRVIPSGERGAHIHFMVIQDKNNDGDFNDNIPDGLTDPFGWQSTSQDPWPDYNFFYKGQQRVGNESYYLWTKSIANLSDQFSSNGGFFQLERYGINIPQGATDDPITINMNLAPIVRVSDILEAIGSTVVIDATGIAGDPVSILEKDFILTIDFSEFDL
ncbi:M23 family metallopeptidase [Patescibacteria group bacterium]|nr:M23 family metallopeptidase [Patescibacteria group bacterium]